MQCCKSQGSSSYCPFKVTTILLSPFVPRTLHESKLGFSSCSIYRRVYQMKQLWHDIFNDIIKLLPPSSLCVHYTRIWPFSDLKVVSFLSFISKSFHLQS